MVDESGVAYLCSPLGLFGFLLLLVDVLWSSRSSGLFFGAVRSLSTQFWVIPAIGH
jgi:hypothetical protein